MYLPAFPRRVKSGALGALLLGSLIALLPFPARATSSVTLRWDASSDPKVAGYDVYYGKASLTYTNKLSVGNVTNATVSGLIGGKTYYFAVTAHDASGVESLPSNEVAYSVPPPPDLIPPTIKPLSPAQDAEFTTKSITFSGSAADDVRVTNVLVSLNGGPYQTATLTLPTPTTADWTIALTLRAGTNSVQIKSIDSSGNESAIATRDFFLRVPWTLTVNVLGSGSVTPNYNHASLYVGRSYIMTATPKANNLFSNILAVVNGSTDAATNPRNYAFTMQSNLTLIVNFVTNAFTVAKGTYNGLFYESEDHVEAASAGSIQVTVSSLTTGGGSFSGQMFVRGAKVKFTGVFDPTGAGHATVFSGPVPSVWPTGLALNLDLAGALSGSNLTMTGTVSNGSAWTSVLVADKRYYNGTGVRCPLGAANYTIILPGTPGGTGGLPAGDGYAAISIAPGGGGVTATGKYADMSGIGITTSQSAPLPAPLSRELRWPFYTPLYSTPPTYAGLGIGWLTFTATNVQGNIVWIKPASVGSVYPVYPGGFTNALPILGSSYVKPPSGGRVINLTSCQVTLASGNLVSPITVSGIAYGGSPAKFALPANSVLLELSLAAGTGTFNNVSPLFTRFVKPGNPSPKTKIYGAVLQNANVARGFFVGPGENRSGSFLLQP